MSDQDSSEDFHAYGPSLLSGELITLRPLDDSDLDILATWWNDPAWMPLQQESALPQPKTAAMEMFRSWSSPSSATGMGYSIVNDADVLVGHVTLWGLAHPVGIATLGIIIGPPHMGRGYGTDAVRTAIRIAFEELGANKVELQVWEFNPQAISVYLKCGFRQEGFRRGAVVHRSRLWGQVLMGLTKEEYEASGLLD
ncbi:MAG: GNAT family N-acetyltransferase [Rhodoglobus sp.]